MKSLLFLLAALLCGQHVMAICSTASNDTIVCGGHGTCASATCTCAIQYTEGASLTAAGALGTRGVLATYAVLGATLITNTGTTSLRGNSGVTSSNAVSGTAPTYAGGTFAFHAHDASANNSMADAVAAYTSFAALAHTLGSPPTALDGLTLPAGVRTMTSGATLTGTFTIDFQNSASSIAVFIVTGTVVTAASSHVTMINGGSACRVFWIVSSSVTLGATSTFTGTVIAVGAVSVGNNARVNGRLVSKTAGVTLSNNYVNATTCSSLVSTCAACPAGTQGTAANVCSNCPIGKYKDVAVPVACHDCQAHSNATTAGATACSCFKGYAGNLQPNQCSACPLGTYKTAVGNGGCTNCTGLHVTTETTASTVATACGCAHGYFGASGGVAPCSKCDQGSYTDTVKSTVCTNCSLEGYASIGTGAVVCEACPWGYTNNTGNTLCSLDIDECSSAKLNNCTNSVCVNTIGNYTCTCIEDYIKTDGWFTCKSPAAAGSGSYTVKVLLIVAMTVAGSLMLMALCYGSKAMGGNGSSNLSQTEFSRVSRY